MATVVAYLGPELPALSATFIYEELLGVERRGVTVRPFTVRRPAQPAAGQEDLAARTQALYGRAAVASAIGGILCLPSFGARAVKAMGWLARDMTKVGLHRPQAWKLTIQWLTGARLARALAREGCTHLHVHFAHTPAQIAMYASAFGGIPFTVMAHANDIFERGLLLREKAQRALKILTISEFNVAHLRSIGLPQGKLAIVRCGVSLPPAPDLPAFESKRHYRLGTLCRLVEKKGVDDLLRALDLLRDAPWGVELSIAGDGPLRHELERMVGALGLDDRVRFVGALDHAAVTGWMRALDIFVLACKKDSKGDMDGIPVVLMEAMSQGVPVVSTRLSGIPELVMHDATGLLAAPGDPISLARELRRLLDDPKLRARCARAAIAHVSAEFGQELNIDRLLSHLEPPTPAHS